jgi:hypothetical protein
LLRARSMQAFYVSRALERVSAFGDWHTHILEPWRTFLAQHLTTWPEYPDPARSDSHAWSAWPAIDYVTTVLGVRPLAPGWPGVRLFPQTAGLDWAKGIAPSPAGLIQVEWRKRGRNVSNRNVSRTEGSSKWNLRCNRSRAFGPLSPVEMFRMTRSHFPVLHFESAERHDMALTFFPFEEEREPQRKRSTSHV